MLLSNLNVQNALVVARTLVATKNVSALGAEDGTGEASVELWRGLVYVARFESGLLDDADLSELVTQIVRVDTNWRRRGLDEMTRDPGHRPPQGYSLKEMAGGSIDIKTPMTPVAHDLLSVIARIRYLRLARELKTGRNPALDADRTILISRMKSIGLREDLVAASDEIERRSAIAASEMDVKSVMDLLRTFFEEFIEDSAKRIETAVGRGVPNDPKRSHFTPFRDTWSKLALSAARRASCCRSCTTSFRIRALTSSRLRPNSCVSPTHSSSSAA